MIRVLCNDQACFAWWTRQTIHDTLILFDRILQWGTKWLGIELYQIWQSPVLFYLATSMHYAINCYTYFWLHDTEQFTLINEKRFWHVNITLVDYIISISDNRQCASSVYNHTKFSMSNNAIIMRTSCCLKFLYFQYVFYRHSKTWLSLLAVDG